MKPKKESLDDAILKKFGHLPAYRSKKGKQKPILERDEVKTHKNYSGEQSPYWSWAENRGLNDGEGREPLMSNPDLASDTPYVDASPDTFKAYDKVMEGVDKLSVREKEVVMLLWEGKTQVEVSSILQIKEGAVRVYLQRARKKLKKYVSEKG